jgi:hypothetical protein
MYGCLTGMKGTGGASAAAGRGRWCAKFCDSISARPASMIAWFFA